MKDNELFIVAGKRSAYGRYLGSLMGVDPVELASTVARAALRQAREAARGDFPIDQTFMGNCIPTTFTSPSTTGRQVSLALGLKEFAVTLDTACCSPLTGLRLATWGMLGAGIGTALVAGVEMMSRVPHLLRDLRSGVKAGAGELIDPIFPIEYKGYTPVSIDASNGAEKYGVPRSMLDAWALGSQQKWARAKQRGLFREEIVPVAVKTKKGETVFDGDEFPRPDSTYSKLQSLPPVFGSKTTTAGNAPGLNDGASAVVAATGRAVTEYGLKPLARILATVGVAGEPEGISWVPAMAIREALKRAGLTVEQLGVIEINEAFAAMPLVSTKILAEGDEGRWLDLLGRTNPNGGAIAIGHPVGASGLRILLTMMYELRRRGGGRGVCAICGGLSQGEAVIIEV